MQLTKVAARNCVWAYFSLKCFIIDADSSVDLWYQAGKDSTSCRLRGLIVKMWWRRSDMATDLQILIERARRVEMTPEEREKQRRSFAYGNSKIENNRISRQSVDKEAKKLATENVQENDA